MNPTFKKRARQLAACLIAAGMVVGCVTPDPDTATLAAAPKTPASKTFTSFTPALQCMDNLMMTYGKHDITITTAGITDSTQKVSVGTKEMLIRALNLMSRKSKAFSYIDYDPLNASFFIDAQRASGAGYKVPSYYIRGAITQLDDNALESQLGGAISTPFADLGISKDQIVSLVGLDMNIGETVSRQIISDAGSSNTMAVVRLGRSGEAGGKIGKMGLSINISFNTSEGLGAAVRALIELGAIEMVGQFSHTPYWKCLQIEKSNPKLREQAREWYDAMGLKDKVSFVQRKLSATNIYQGSANGELDSATREAIGRYQASNGLIANGQTNFELYFALLDDEAPVADDTRRPPPVTVTKTLVPVTVLSDRGANPTYEPNSILSARVDLGRNSFLYCYYQDADGTIARLFPNRFQPNAYVSSRMVPLSAPQQPVKIRFDKAGHEVVSCLASESEVPLPAKLKEKDLTRLAVGSLEEIDGIFRAANPNVSTSRLDITVQ